MYQDTDEHRGDESPLLQESGGGWRKDEVRTLAGVNALSFLQWLEDIQLVENPCHLPCSFSPGRDVGIKLRGSWLTQVDVETAVIMEMVA